MKENKHIIYFDGICGLCNSFVSFLLKIDSSSNLKFATIQGESGQKLLNKMNFIVKFRPNGILKGTK